MSTYPAGYFIAPAVAWWPDWKPSIPTDPAPFRGRGIETQQAQRTHAEQLITTGIVGVEQIAAITGLTERQVSTLFAGRGVRREGAVQA